MLAVVEQETEGGWTKLRRFLQKCRKDTEIARGLFKGNLADELDAVHVDEPRVEVGVEEDVARL